ncbi:methyltransferase domain-containing protein [Streptomyces sp. J2-1]|uniref:putative RNA methyltransferase n=1 Tax=Streptomyces corallincola TaxID=2851888 RepID=UPI001C393FEB|nr:methyltransferase domain-containing protein [Streptomyces corallincola]MBV2356846.1 methyltransferase domain-containing protein [Streptomyces corallincola]
MPALFPPALVPFLDVLCCPVCRARLHPGQGALRCPDGHAFDIARQGYAALLTGARATSGDDADMVQARMRFLAAGAYEPVREALTRLAADALPGPGTVADLGCGTGHYLAGVLDRLPAARGLGLDTSVRALRAAVRSHPRAAAASWDVFRPFPLADRSLDLVLNVFAPRNPPEFHRVLRPSGRLIVIRPTHHHLAELRRRFPAMLTIDPAKEQRLHTALTPHFEPTDTLRVAYTTPLTPQESQDLLTMTPTRHPAPATPTDPGSLPGRVTVSVLATAYRPVHFCKQAACNC